MSSKYEGDETDFSHVPWRGKPNRPNDFFSYYVTEEEEEQQEFIITAPEDMLMKFRPFIKKVVMQLPTMGDHKTILVHLKCGVNTADIRFAIEDDRRGGSFGPNRKIQPA